MKDELSIKLKYSGADVDDGTMSVEDMIPALQGFSSAYGKLVNSDEVQVKHKLRVVGVEKGSFDILLQVVGDVVQNVNIDTAFTVKAALGYLVIDKIVGVIKITKHTKNQAYDTKVNGVTGNVTIINTDKLSLDVPHDVYQIFHSKLLQPDINKIAEPLESGKIESTEIVAEGGGKQIREKISVDEKRFFSEEPQTVTKTTMTELMGFFVSLYKTTNKGFFVLNDGSRVTYRLVIPNPELLWPLVIHKGLVKIKAVVHLDANLKPNMIDVYEVEPVQGSLLDVLKDAEEGQE